MHVLIVDDELLARNRLRVLLSECEDPLAPFTVTEAATAAQALESLQQSDLPLDLLLLDISVPSTDGQQLAQALRKMPTAPSVVWVTTQSMHVTSAFEINAADFIPKPVRLERLQQAIAKVRRLRALEGGSDEMAPALIIRDRGRAERIPLHYIVYLKAEQKYVTVRTASRTYILDSSLCDLEQRFPRHFLRIHRNALVNPAQIRMLEKQFTDDDGECWAMRLHSVPEALQVSRRQLTSVRTTLHNMTRHAVSPQAAVA